MKRKPRYNTCETYEWKDEFGTGANGESKTVPGESYTINQLLQRAQSGIALNTIVDVKDPYFATDDDFDTFAPEGEMDLVDYENLDRESRQTIAEAETALAEGSKTKTKQVAEDTKESDQGAISPSDEPVLKKTIEPENKP